jgi:hypothetical protein
MRILFVAPFISALKHRTESGQYLNIIREQPSHAPSMSTYYVYVLDGQGRSNSFKSWDAVLKELRVDMICFQGLPFDLPGSHCPLSSRTVSCQTLSIHPSPFPPRKEATAVSLHTDTPLKAEEGGL